MIHRQSGVDSSGPEIHLALLAPEIPWNTGNIGRTCLAAGAKLHLVRPLGFSLDARHLRRAGLDYWPEVDPRVWSSWSEFERQLPELGEPWLFSAEGERSLWDAPLDHGTPVLIFGCETSGLPGAIRKSYRDRLLRIPMSPGPVRSLNLSTAAALALFEVKRRAAIGD